jgi:isoleucyl-tRNA synthetase
MSKSLGNSIRPQDVITESGAEILRLWVAMSDYSEELRVSKEILTRVVDAYRKIRNVLRVLAGNLYDFDPASDAVPRARMLAIDRWMMATYAEAAERIIKAYDDYEYPAVFQATNQLVTVDVSAFYVDVTKDRMYTFGAKSEARRSGQTAMFLVAEGLTRLLATILPFTMDELWKALPGTREPSVHLTLFPRDFDEWRDRPLLNTWEFIRGVRHDVNEQLEKKRAEKVIRASLEAAVGIAASGGLLAILRNHEADLPAVFGVSQVELMARDLGEVGEGEAVIGVARAAGVKCERCWRYVPSVSEAPEVKGICERCVDALAEPVTG